MGFVWCVSVSWDRSLNSARNVAFLSYSAHHLCAACAALALLCGIVPVPVNYIMPITFEYHFCAKKRNKQNEPRKCDPIYKICKWKVLENIKTFLMMLGSARHMNSKIFLNELWLVNSIYVFLRFFFPRFFKCLLCLLTADRVGIVTVVTGMLIPERGTFSQWDSLAVLLELCSIISILRVITQLIWFAFHNTEFLS